MKKLLLPFLLVLAGMASAQEPDPVMEKAQALEAQLNRVLDTSPEGAKAMLDLVDLYLSLIHI